MGSERIRVVDHYCQWLRGSSHCDMPGLFHCTVHPQSIQRDGFGRLASWPSGVAEAEKQQSECMRRDIIILDHII